MQLHSVIIRAASLARDLISQHIQTQPPCILCINNEEIRAAKNIDGYKIN
jgi:hypothetical protein